MQEDMRGLFFILKGQYSKNVAPIVVNRVTEENMSVGCYDPSRETTVEWYQLMDCKKFDTLACGSDLNKVLNGVKTAIIRYRGHAQNYFKVVDNRRKEYPNSPIMFEHYRNAYEYYGDYYFEEIEKLEDEAYKIVRERFSPTAKANKALKRSRGLVKRVSTPEPVEEKKKAAPQVKTELKKKGVVMKPKKLMRKV